MVHAHLGIGRITYSGEITKFSVTESLDAISEQNAITAGPDGAIWFGQGTEDLRVRARRGPPSPYCPALLSPGSLAHASPMKESSHGHTETPGWVSLAARHHGQHDRAVFHGGIF